MTIFSRGKITIAKSDTEINWSIVKVRENIVGDLMLSQRYDRFCPIFIAFKFKDEPCSCSTV